MDMNYILRKESHSLYTTQANAVAERNHVTKQIGTAVFKGQNLYEERNVIVFRKNKTEWLCIATQNGNVIAYNFFNKKIMQNFTDLATMYDFISNNTKTVNISEISEKIVEMKDRESDYFTNLTMNIFKTWKEDDSSCFIENFGSAGDEVICELCGETFSATGIQEICAHCR